MSSRRALTTAVALLIAFGPGLAVGQPRSESRADELFRAGRAAMRRGEYVTACARFTESQRLDPAAGTLLNIATCEDKQGHNVTAWQTYRGAAAQLLQGDPRRDLAVGAAEQLAKKVARITVTLAAGAPPSTRVTLGDSPARPIALDTEVAIEPGVCALIVTAAGAGDRRIEITLRAGEQRTLEVAPGPSAAEASASAPDDDGPVGATRSDVGTSGRGRDRRTLGWVLIGTGAIAEGAAVYFALEAKSKDHAAQKYCQGTICWDQAGIELTERSQRAGRYATIASVGGALTAVGGLALVYAWPAPNDSAKRDIVVRTTVSTGAVGLRLGGRW